MMSLLTGVIAINTGRHAKKQIKEELLPKAWGDWCMPENEKKRDKEILA